MARLSKKTPSSVNKNNPSGNDGNKDFTQTNQNQDKAEEQGLRELQNHL